MKQLVITTKSWKALIESLKGNAKHGYNKLESLKQVDGYFTAVLCQETDEKYVDRLKVVTGTETDIEEYVDFLAASPVPSISAQGVEVLKVEPVQTEAVTTKIKRTTRKPKESK